MMGTKVRSFAPLPEDVSLEDLVPEDNFYSRLEARLDLSFVRELVAPLYAKCGRPSVDPVVFFKLQLVMFFEHLRFERQLVTGRSEDDTVEAIEDPSCAFVLGVLRHPEVDEKSQLIKVLVSEVS